MRKAGLARKGPRRRLSTGSTSTQQNLPGSSMGTAAPNNSSGPEAGAPERQRMPTHEEEALTAKNYRLAKELSDLRVRHRNETRTVTRLTMENMNLASRCRETISHVSMLKRELASHQRRAAEALALQQRQRSRRSLSESEGELFPTSLDRALYSPSPPPPPSNQKLVRQRHDIAEVSSSTDSVEKEMMPPSDFYDVSNWTRGGPPDASWQQGQKTSVLSPRGFKSAEGSAGLDSALDISERSGDVENAADTAIDRMNGVLAEDETLDERDPGDDSDSRKKILRPPLSVATTEMENDMDGLSVYASPRIVESDGVGLQTHQRDVTRERGDDSSNDTMEKPSRSAAHSTWTMPKEGIGASAANNIGANTIETFDASFDAAFPITFSTAAAENDAPPSLDIAFDVPEFSDPFFLGSLDGGGGNGISPFLEPNTSNASKASIDARKAALNVFGETGGRTTTRDELTGGRAVVAIEVSANGANHVDNSSLPLDPFPSSAMGAFENHMSAVNSPALDGFFQTDPLPDIEPPIGSNHHEVMSSPRALKENSRRSGGKSSDHHRELQHPILFHDTPDNTNHSPSEVLKRMQLQKVRGKKNDSFPNSSLPVEKNLVAFSTDLVKVSETVNEDTILLGTHFHAGDDGDGNASHISTLNYRDYGPKAKKNIPVRENQVTGKGRGTGGKREGRLVGMIGNLSQDSMGAEMRQLDAIFAHALSGGEVPTTSTATGGNSVGNPDIASQSPQAVSSRRRRNIAKQPTTGSAEPVLSPKHRHFSPKNAQKPEAGGVKLRGAAQASEDVDSIDNENAVNLRHAHNTSVEDVLKDLYVGPLPNSTLFQL